MNYIPAKNGYYKGQMQAASNNYKVIYYFYHFQLLKMRLGLKCGSALL